MRNGISMKFMSKFNVQDLNNESLIQCCKYEYGMTCQISLESEDTQTHESGMINPC